MRTLQCFTIIPSNREEQKSELMLDSKRGWVERPDSCTGAEKNEHCYTVDFDSVYTQIIEEAVQAAADECRVPITNTRGKDIKTSGHILGQLIEHICSADITITDLTTYNPDVLLEYGIRASVKDKLNIIIAHDPCERPDDLRSYGHIPYAMDMVRGGRAKKQIKDEIVRYIKKTDQAGSDEIKRLVDANTERRRESSIIQALEPAPQLVAELTGFLYQQRGNLPLKLDAMEFLERVGKMLEEDPRGKEKAIAHYLMMTEIQGLERAILQKFFTKVAALYSDINDQDKADEYLAKAENLEEQAA